MRATGCSIGAVRQRRVFDNLGPVGCGDRHENACERAEQLEARAAAAVQRLVADLEQQPLLRVGGGRLSRRDPKTVRVEEVDVEE